MAAFSLLAWQLKVGNDPAFKVTSSEADAAQAKRVVIRRIEQRTVIVEDSKSRFTADREGGSSVTDGSTVGAQSSVATGMATDGPQPSAYPSQAVAPATVVAPAAPKVQQPARAQVQTPTVVTRAS